MSKITFFNGKYFSADYDPFYPNQYSPEKSGNSNKIKLTLIPPPQKIDTKKVTKEDEDILGINEFLKEEAPQIPEY